jgi:glycogen debranching enzyme
MVKQNILDEAYNKAFETIKKCSTSRGLYASGGKKGYKGVWARDSMISLIGASTEKSKLFKEQFKKSLLTLGKYQSKLGQIPNAVLHFERKKPEVDFKSIDSSLWFVIGHYLYREGYRDASLFNKEKNKIKKALTWIAYRDEGEDVTLEQLPTTDWQDAFPEKFGAVISTQALYYKVLELVDKKKARRLKLIVNNNKEDKLWNKEFYWAYRWKNHNKYKEIGEWFDSFGNILAILFGLCDKEQSKKILSYIRKHKINRPYSLRDIHPPIKKTSEYWQDYYYDAKATPNNYLNGGIWPYIGGFYVLALIKMKMFKEAETELERLAEANLKGNVFPEWIDPTTKETHGEFQAWSAGTYMLAYNSLKTKKVLI